MIDMDKYAVELWCSLKVSVDALCHVVQSLRFLLGKRHRFRPVQQHTRSLRDALLAGKFRLNLTLMAV